MLYLCTSSLFSMFFARGYGNPYAFASTERKHTFTAGSIIIGSVIIWFSLNMLAWFCSPCPFHPCLLILLLVYAICTIWDFSDIWPCYQLEVLRISTVLFRWEAAVFFFSLVSEFIDMSTNAATLTMPLSHDNTFGSRWEYGSKMIKNCNRGGVKSLESLPLRWPIVKLSLTTSAKFVLLSW